MISMYLLMDLTQVWNLLGTQSNQTRMEFADVSLRACVHVCVCVFFFVVCVCVCLNTYVRVNVGLPKFFCADVDLVEAAICNQDYHCLPWSVPAKSSFF